MHCQDAVPPVAKLECSLGWRFQSRLLRCIKSLPSEPRQPFKKVSIELDLSGDATPSTLRRRRKPDRAVETMPTFGRSDIRPSL